MNYSLILSTISALSLMVGCEAKGLLKDPSLLMYKILKRSQQKLLQKLRQLRFLLRILEVCMVM